MLKLTIKMSGKMEGMTSINTACSNNTRCQARIKAAALLIEKLNIKDKKDLKKRLKAGKIDTKIYNIMICWFCYADSLLSCRATARNAFEENGEILRSHLLEEEEIPLWPTFYGRIEAFGDVDNEKKGGVIQARNYIRIMKYNPRVKFGAWTKNPDIWQKAFEIEGKPENMIMVQSSVSVDRPDKLYSSYFDKVFTVWSSEEAATTGALRTGSSVTFLERNCTLLRFTIGCLCHYFAIIFPLFFRNIFRFIHCAVRLSFCRLFQALSGTLSKSPPNRFRAKYGHSVRLASGTFHDISGNKIRISHKTFQDRNQIFTGNYLSNFKDIF